MTEQQIITLFKEELEKPNFSIKSGATKQKLYNYRHRKCKVSLMLEILWKVEAIKIVKA